MPAVGFADETIAKQPREIDRGMIDLGGAEIDQSRHIVVREQNVIAPNVAKAWMQPQFDSRPRLKLGSTTGDQSARELNQWPHRAILQLRVDPFRPKRNLKGVQATMDRGASAHPRRTGLPGLMESSQTTAGGGEPGGGWLAKQRFAGHPCHQIP